MTSFLQKAFGLIHKGRAEVAAGGIDEGLPRDWLPPVLAPSSWSDDLLQAMADGGATWYFDRPQDSGDRSERR